MPKDFAQIVWDAAVEDDARQLIRLAVREDLERQLDWTTIALVDPEALGVADVVARAGGIVAGLPAARLALDEMDPRLDWQATVDDGATVEPGQRLATISGPARSLLTAERPLLNMLGHLSGVATLARRYVDAVSGTRARVYDTRKTTPGWRRLEKYAARLGGAHNHRTGLFDAVLIKDNHLALGGWGGRGADVFEGAKVADSNSADRHSPGGAVRRARAFLAQRPEGRKTAEMIVEIEVDTREQFRDALAARPDIILLDNMSLDELRGAVAERDALAAGVELEASGGVRLDTIAEIARTGVDRISVGALTHSAAWLDVGLDWRSRD